METIEINIPFSEIENRKRRIEAALNFARVDRVPVQLCMLPRYWLNELKVDYDKYRNNAEMMLRTQLLAQKWLYENLKTDDIWSLAHLDLASYYSLAWILGCELEFDDYTPWIKTHAIKTPRDLKKIERIDVRDNPVVVKEAKLCREMQHLSEEFQIRYVDGKITPVAETIVPPVGATKVITLAVDLRGPEIYLDMKENPQFVKDLMEVVIEKTIEREKYMHEVYGLSMENGFLVDDSAACISPEDYREFVLPYNLKMKEHFKGKCTLHCDGAADHLLEIFAKEIRPDIYWAFGYEQSRVKVRDYMSGKVVLIGNISPMKIAIGKRQEVYDDAMEALEYFAPGGGYIIMDGANICPGSPKENINALYQASVDYSKRHGSFFSESF